MDLGNISNVSYLAAGGAIAAVAGFWSHFRNALKYLSSFLIIHASMDDPMAHQVRSYLKINYKLLPSGTSFYKTIWAQINGHTGNTLVPYRFENPHLAIYIKGLSFVVFKSKTFEMLSIRGLANFDHIIGESLKFYLNVLNDIEHPFYSNNRFTIYKMVGQEKGQFSIKDDRPQSSSGTVEPTHPGKSASAQLDLYPSTGVDYSFLYNKEDFHDGMENPFERLYYDDSVMELVAQAKNWVTKGDWYGKRNIPWRRGWLLVGEPGGGKSSLAKGVAQELGIPLYNFFLSTLSDQEFMEKFNEILGPAVVLFEDFDNVFHGRENQTKHRSLSFDCILNQLSGVSSVDGIFLIITANDISKIDSAIGIPETGNGLSTRPGRIDNVIVLGYMSEANRFKMANRILQDWPLTITDTVAKYTQVTPVQFQEVCLREAYRNMALPIFVEPEIARIPETVTGPEPSPELVSKPKPKSKSKPKTKLEIKDDTYRVVNEEQH